MKRFGIGFAVLVLAAAQAAAGELDVARAALRDGLWAIARSHVDENGGDEARKIILESYALEDRWDEVKRSLARWPEAKGPVFDYYRAASEGDFKSALSILRADGAAGHFPDAKMFEAEVLERSGDRRGAERLWREVISMTNASERAFTLASVNLGDVDAMRRAYSSARTDSMKRLAGLRLGTALLKSGASADEGARMILAVVKDAPDAPGAREAFLAIADACLAAERWADASRFYHEAIETWPEAARMAAVQEARGWAFQKLGRHQEALDAFARAADLAADDDARATAVMKTGDVLSELGRGEEAMAKYREVLERFPSTPVADRLKKLVQLRELETRGRESYRSYHFAEAMEMFAEVAAKDPSRKPRMDFYEVLCLYGQGMDEAAVRKASALASGCSDRKIRAEALLWLAKFDYNRSDWKTARVRFAEYASMLPDSPSAPMALLWAARAALAENDLERAIKTVTALVERYPASSAVAPALLVQGEALIGEARFDEAVLVLERVAIAQGDAADRTRAQMLKADALFAMGADNPVRYSAALEAYQAIKFGGSLSPSENIVVSFKIARSLERLKRVDEAIDTYYTRVVLAYREGRGRDEYYDDAAKAAFSRAAFWLADEYEMRGMAFQATSVLRLVASSDVPAAEEAARRIERISMKGRFL
jgi:tetratricopeptide (TPR) repeat protein